MYRIPVSFAVPAMVVAGLALACLAVAAPPSSAAAAERQDFRGDYTVSYLGLPVARASFESRYAAGSYEIRGSVSSAGLAQVFDDTHGTLVTSGRLLDDRIEPSSFRADYKSGKKASLIDMRFAGGKVVDTKVVPAPKKRGKNWLPVDPVDLAGVADPIAATVVVADSIEKVCNRTVKMYDGEMRANLKLALVSKGSISVKGYSGPTVTCRLNFEPVGGFRKGSKGLDFLSRKSVIQVTFAPLGKTGVYAPVYATVGTQIGTITVSAQQFKATN